jgi:hypothetical protein
MTPGAEPYRTLKKKLLKHGIEPQRMEARGFGRPMAAYLPNGRKVYLYPKGYMASALGISRGGLRRLEWGGGFPATCFRDEFGCKAYSLEQIRAAVLLCDQRAKALREEAAGKRGRWSPIGDPVFVDGLQAAFDELEKLYRGEKGGGEVIEAIGINPFPRFDRFPEKRGVHDMRDPAKNQGGKKE